MRRILLPIAILAAIGIAVLAWTVVKNQGPDVDVASHNTWRNLNINAYQMTVVAMYPPAPTVALDLVVRDGEIVDQTIIACERPTDEFPARICEPVRKWYTYMARQTIEDLIDAAEQCLEQTRVILRTCPSAPADFQRFEDDEEMFRIAESCLDAISSESVCTVQYDDTYGFPEELSFHMPGVEDGSGVVSVRDFQPLE